MSKLLSINKIIKSQKTIYLNLILSIIGIITLFSIYLIEIPSIAFALETTGEAFGISIFPTSNFLTAPNMAPGDTVSADLTVKNEGQLDFCYDISAQLDATNDETYNIYDVADLQIKQGTIILYSGKLKDLSKAPIGVLGSQKTDVLNFSVTFPAESGNEYQGKSAEVTFVLNAVEHPPTIADGKIVWDPPLEKADVHVRAGKIMPIRFHIVKEDGAFDNTKRGIDLVISGVDNSSQAVEYRFRIADGTLGWDGQLAHPHYELHFDAEKYPVQLDTYYTATVKYGEQILGSTQFKSGH